MSCTVWCASKAKPRRHPAHGPADGKLARRRQPRKVLSSRILHGAQFQLLRSQAIELHTFHDCVDTALGKTGDNDCEAAAMLLNDWMSTVENLHGRVTW